MRWHDGAEEGASRVRPGLDLFRRGVVLPGFLAHHGFEVALVLVQHALGRHHVPFVQALEQMMLHHAVEVLHRDGLLQRRQQLLFSSSALISSTLVRSRPASCTSMRRSLHATGSTCGFSAAHSVGSYISLRRIGTSPLILPCPFHSVHLGRMTYSGCGAGCYLPPARYSNG